MNTPRESGPPLATRSAELPIGGDDAPRNEDILRMLYEATSAHSGSFAERMHGLFELGHRVLGLRIGLLARIQGECYEVVEASAPEQFGLKNGQTFALGDTFCRDAMDAQGPVGFHCAAGSCWATHPAYEKFQLESYLGVPLEVDGEVFGTLNFSDPEPRARPFAAFQFDLLRLMARWVGREMERSRAAVELERKNRMQESLGKAQAAFIHDGDARDVFDQLLGVLLELTDSEYGFIGEMLRDPGDTPYLKTHAITNIAWNEETRTFYEENAPQGMVFKNLATLFGQVMASEQPVIANQPGTDPRRGGLPEGHPDLRHFLGLPFHFGSRMVGMVGIANRPGGYDRELCAFLDPLLSTCGSIIGALRSQRGRRKAEQALAESEIRARSVLATAADGIITVDHRGIIDSYNPAAERIFGYRADEVVGKPVHMLVPSPHAERHDDYIERFHREGGWRDGATTREVTGLRKDGSTVPLELGISNVPLHDRHLFTAFVRDITERKHAEEELSASNRELREFTYIASHDLQEPLRKLSSFADLLVKDLGDGLPENAARDLDFITDAAHRMQDLVQDLLSLSRTGSAAIERQRVSLGDCVAGAVQALSMRIEETGAELRHGSLPDVPGDRTLLTQLFQNLIGNALKFVREEPPRVEITVEADAQGPVFGVRDNGIGIAPAYGEQIFAPFKRLHGREAYDGTGIGLAICRKAVERHGGRIWVDSKPGVGSHFRFTLGAG